VAKRCLDLGLMISLAGPVTYKNARALPDVARFVPADRLVVETDCPYLPPHPHRGQRNEPAWVAITTAHVAGLRGVTPEALGATVTENAHRLFRIPTRPLA
jgi:TatD DNase family protein